VYGGYGYLFPDEYLRQSGYPANPATYYFSLGRGTPQVREPNVYAAGTAACEIRIVKSTTIQPSTPDQHQMTVPIDYGMWSWTCDQSGNRTAVKGLINPFWIAVNMLLRAMGLYGDPSTGSNPAGGTGPTSYAQTRHVRAAFLDSGRRNRRCGDRGMDQVAAIRGTGPETQLEFQGITAARSRSATGSPRCSTAAWASTRLASLV
jgi:hypothetical protein